MEIVREQVCSRRKNLFRLRMRGFSKMKEEGRKERILVKSCVHLRKD